MTMSAQGLTTGRATPVAHYSVFPTQSNAVIEAARNGTGTPVAALTNNLASGNLAAVMISNLSGKTEGTDDLRVAQINFNTDGGAHNGQIDFLTCNGTSLSSVLQLNSDQTVVFPGSLTDDIFISKDGTNLLKIKNNIAPSDDQCFRLVGISNAGINGGKIYRTAYDLYAELDATTNIQYPKEMSIYGTGGTAVETGGPYTRCNFGWSSGNNILEIFPGIPNQPAGGSGGYYICTENGNGETHLGGINIGVADHTAGTTRNSLWAKGDTGEIWLGCAALVNLFDVPDWDIVASDPTPVDILHLTPPPLIAPGHYDSHSLLWTAQSFDTEAHTTDWRSRVTTTNNAGSSFWILETRVNEDSYRNMLVIDDLGNTGFGQSLGPTNPIDVTTPAANYSALRFRSTSVVFGGGYLTTNDAELAQISAGVELVNNSWKARTSASAGTGKATLFNINAGGITLLNDLATTNGGSVSYTTIFDVAANGNVTLKSGASLQIGNNATTGLSAGVLAASTNASIVIKDASGQAYRIPCII